MFSRPQRFVVNYSYDLPFGKHDGITGRLLERLEYLWCDPGSGWHADHGRRFQRRYHLRNCRQRQPGWIRPRSNVPGNDLREYPDTGRHRGRASVATAADLVTSIKRHSVPLPPSETELAMATRDPAFF